MKYRKRHSKPVIVEAGINIREVRPGLFQVDHQAGRKRERKCYRDLEQAKTHCQTLARKLANEGASALAISPAQRMDAASAFKVLEGRATLADAVAYWAKHNAPEGGVTLKELVRRWVVALRAQGCRDTTMRDREHKLDRLCSDYGERPAIAITRDDLAKWMDSYRLGGVTRDGYRRCYHALFNYAIAEGIIEANPVAGMKPPKVDERLPVPFTVKQAAAIMAAAELHAPNMVPLLAVQFFGGLRPGEAKGLDWSAVDFGAKLIRVLPETSKVRRSRLVELNPTLREWLLAYKHNAGPIGPTTQNQFDYSLRRKEITLGEGDDQKTVRGIIGAAGVEWIQDGPRKTFATMHYANNSDAAKLAAILGHTGGVDVLFRHYRGLATKPEARKYWAIRPERGTMVLGAAKRQTSNAGRATA